MRLQRILTLLILVLQLTVHAQASTDPTANNVTVVENVTDIDKTGINTPIDECDSWIGTLFASDLDASNGLSESEYHTFLSSIKEPPYVAEYFRGTHSFNQLSWVFRAVHKSLACHCQRIGMGAGCCTGADAEVLLNGLRPVGNMTGKSVDEEYVAFFCQQIDYVLKTSIFGPTPTSRPSTLDSSAPAPSPEGETSDSLSSTLKPSVNVAFEAVSEVTVDEGASEQEQDDGLGTGKLVGIVIAVFLALIPVIALVSYRHKLMERASLSNPQDSDGLDVDIEATPAIEFNSEVTPVTPEHEQTADDNCVAPPVMSEISPWTDDEIQNLIALVEAESELHSSSFLETVPSQLETVPSQLEFVLSQVESIPSHVESETDSEPEEEEEEESYASSVWSESDAGESGINYNNCASTLAALGVASTMTAKLMAPAYNEDV